MLACSERRSTKGAESISPVLLPAAVIDLTGLL